jgi:hypothetical protein
VQTTAVLSGYPRALSSKITEQFSMIKPFERPCFPSSTQPESANKMIYYPLDCYSVKPKSLLQSGSHISTIVSKKR